MAAPRLTAVNKKVVNGASEHRMPLENYATRQKSLGFLAGLMDRWK
jgi:hypothetical protein